MTYTNHVRINELARELEVKSKVIIRLLPGFGVTGKKTRSSSIPMDIAEKIRAANSFFHNPAAPSVLFATPTEHAPSVAPDLPTYEELLARLYRLEAQRSALTRPNVPARGWDQRPNKKKRKKNRKKKRKANPKSEQYRTVSGGLPSLGKRR